MSENHSQDKETQQHIDRLLAGKTETNDPLLKAMIGTRPQASRSFQDALENQLLAQLDSAEVYEEENVSLMNITTDTAIPIRQIPDSQTKRRFPVTLIAAMLAIIIFGGFLTLIFNSGGDDDIYLSGITDEVQQDATPELSTDCPTDADTNYFLYVVQEGDTLAGIAENFGIDISQMSNCIDESLPRDASLSAGNIQVGDTLYILMSNNQDIQEEDTCQIDESIPTQSYYVQESDTLIGIAVRFEVDIEDIIALNCLNEDGDGAFQFRLDQEILIPDTRQMSIDACTVRLASANSPVFIMSDARTDSTELYRITNSVLVLDTEVNPDSNNNAEWYYVRATVDRALIEGYVLASLLTSPDDDCVYISQESTTPGQVRNPSQVVVAARDLAMGTVLEREDLDTISIMPDDIDQPFVFCCVELLIGREVIEPVTAGAFVTENVLGLNPETGTINGQHLPENIVATQDAVVTPTPPVLGVISGMNRVNMRTEPNTTSDIITTLAVGTGIELIRQNEDGSWLQVRLDDGRTGWVAIGFIRIDESAISNAPAPEIDAFEATATQLVINATGTAEPIPIITPTATRIP